MNVVQQIAFEPFYKKDNGMLVYRVDDDSVPVPFPVRYKSMIYLPPNTIGGNHKHARQEAFIGSQYLDFAWIDEGGESHRESMVKDGIPILFVVSPHIPHAVINTSKTEQATLFEFADDPILKPELVIVV